MGSPLARMPTPLHGFNPPFNRLFEQFVAARNDALHQGAFARHLTTHAIQVSLILEDALMDGSDKIGDYMVRNVVTASLWQPISFIRQQLLVNSFSYLPVLDDAGVPLGLIADSSLACYLGRSRKERIAHFLSSAIESGEVALLPTSCYSSSERVQVVLADDNMRNQRLPVLVVDEYDGRKRLIGLVTAFDLL